MEIRTVSYLKDNPEVEKIFSDLKSYKSFCKNAWLDGDSKSYVFDEKDLYDNTSHTWQMYNRQKNIVKRKMKKLKNKKRN